MGYYELLLARKLSGGGGGGGGGGSSVDVEPLSVTANGTYTAPEGTAYSPVSVNVSGFTFEEIIGRTQPTGNVKIENLSSLGAYAIYGFTNMTSLFSNSITTLSDNSITTNSGLQTVVLTTLSGQLTSYSLGANPNLKKIDIDGNIQLGVNCLRNNTLMNTLILRNSSVVMLNRNEALYGTPFANGGAGGEIYVPQSLISSYQTATNWSTYNGYGTITWKAIEGSQYENYYADGTPIGA